MSSLDSFKHVVHLDIVELRSVVFQSEHLVDQSDFVFIQKNTVLIQLSIEELFRQSYYLSLLLDSVVRFIFLF